MSFDAAAEEQFGPYLVYERLGVGGMATVHRALEQGAEGFERVVALKRLLPHLAEDASFIKSFVREAKLASLLNHVNIVQIYELGRVGTEYFISMEYIDGRDLRRVLRHARKVTGPPPIHITVGLMLQLCEALDYAHNKVDDDGHPLGLVHRDISPSNLLVTSAGNVKIIDFGIAKAQSSQLRTHTGRVKGKLAYMAPEAVSGSRDLDARSDIWAAGVILHELLTARPLFASKNEYQTLLKVQRGDIMPPSTFNQACPPELDAIVFRTLARNADERYANASELRDALMMLKRQYSFQTGYRDIAGWLDWAFGLEQPPSFSPDGDTSGVVAVETPKPARAKTPRPARNTEEDEACEVVWGGGNVESENGPVVLDDVPDVSAKHQRPRRDTEEGDQVDDIPTPLPSHGTLPSIYGPEQIVMLSQPKNDAVVRNARGSEQLRAHRQTSGPHTIPRAQTQTGPHIVPRSNTGSHAVPRSNTGSHAVPRSGATGQHQAHKSTGPMPALDTPLINERMAAQRARETEPPEYRRKTVDTGESTNPGPHRLPTEPSRPISLALGTGDALRAEDDHAFAASAQPTKEMPPSAPHVRFSRPQSTPPETVRAYEHDAPRTTTLGIPPPVRATTPNAERPFANIRIGESIAARSVQPKRTWMYALGGLVLVAGTAVAVALMSSRDHSATKQDDKALARPTRETGTVKFVTEPVDAEIRIEGNEVHAGSPWASELAAGVHQIEIHRKGYKSWLTSLELSANETQTLRVVLEPLTTNVGDATLTIATTPSGLEVLIDGYVQPQRTPFKSTLKVGAHKIAVRQNGVDVWTQSLDAEASSDYEFNPSFTADKQRERAQRTPDGPKPATPSDSPPDTADHQDPSPDWIKPAQQPTAIPAVIEKGDKAAATITPPPATTPAPAPAPPPKQAAPVPTPTPSPAKAPQITATPAPAPATQTPKLVSPKIVAPTAVKKVSGDVPSISKFRNVELPPSLAAKVCIDETGKVSFAEMVQKLDRRVATDLTDTLRSWRYAAYMQNGVAIPACFVVSFRVK